MNDLNVNWSETGKKVEEMKEHFANLLEVPKDELKFVGMALYFSNGEATIQNRIFVDGFDPDEEETDQVEVAP